METLVSELFRLGLLAGIFVVLFFLLIFRNPLGVCLSLIPMLGAFCVTLGTMGAFKIGIPFSIIGVAPIIFGLAIDNGIHIVMRSMEDKTVSLEKVMKHITPLITVTSFTTLLGFLSMMTSSQYAMEFLGFSLVIGMATALIFTLVPLPALLLLLERRTNLSNTGL